MIVFCIILLMFSKQSFLVILLKKLLSSAQFMISCWQTSIEYDICLQESVWQLNLSVLACAYKLVKQYMFIYTCCYTHRINILGYQRFMNVRGNTDTQVVIHNRIHCCICYISCYYQCTSTAAVAESTVVFIVIIVKGAVAVVSIVAVAIASLK